MNMKLSRKFRLENSKSKIFLQEFEYTVIYNFYVELQATKEKSLAQRKFA